MRGENWWDATLVEPEDINIMLNLIIGGNAYGQDKTKIETGATT